MNRPLRIAIVSGESSGDQLGAGLIKALRARHPDAEIAGIGGDRMMAAGFESWYEQDRLAVMGLFEVIRHLPDLLSLRRTLRQRIIDWSPDVFLGIDSPDFNLPLARQLRTAGVTTAHYVSPSVWAWRQGRVVGIRASVDLMLTLFPFEGDFYGQHDVPYVCVGHTLADALPLTTDTNQYRAALDLTSWIEGPLVALLPGSRRGEVATLGGDFLQAVRLLKARMPDLKVIIPAAGEARMAQIQALLIDSDADWIRVFEGRGHEVLGACDAALLASGTATLEAALLKKPMVVGYRFSALTYAVGRHFVKTPWAALPNILARRTLVPELIQHDLTPQRAADELALMLTDEARRADCLQTFADIHRSLKRNADEVAASALLDLVASRQTESPTHA